jgi:ATP-binding cassette subfamily B multidrug efflux pump
MRHDMGYFEEQQLGKPYDVRMLKRLFPFSTPYKLTIFISICLVMMITCLDLAVPYITKIAIDRYIVPNVDANGLLQKKKPENGSRYLAADMEDPRIRTVVDRHPELFERKALTTIIAFENLSKLKPDELAALRGKDLLGVKLISLVFLVIIFFDFIFNFLQKLLMEYTGHMIMHDLRLKLFEHIQSLSASFFTRNPVGRLVTRVTNDIQNMYELFTSVISLVFKDFFLLMGIAIVLIAMNWKMALVSFTVLPFVWYTAMRFSGRVRDVFRQLRINIAEINTKFSEMIDGVKVIQSFGKEALTFDNFSPLNHENYLAGMQQIHVLAIFMPLIEVFGVFTVSVIIYYGGKNVLSENISLGVLVAFISYMRMFFRPIRDLAEKYNILQNALSSAERIFLILDTEDRTEVKKTTGKTGNAGSILPASEKINDIAFENVTFSYMPSEPVLTNVSIKVRAGETLAIVGPTGSGKTSLINLMMRFYDPSSGKILINGKDIGQLPYSELRSRMALVTQEPFLFTDTVQNNIWRDKLNISGEEISRVLDASNCRSFIDRLPEGLHTILSSGGAALSSGERQLISIARAFAKNPELIILDEATSYIDSQTEKVIQDALKNLMSGRTAFVVAHRLSTIRHADKIVVIDGGKIIEHGTHDTLMRKMGFYYQLNHLQTCLGASC